MDAGGACVIDLVQDYVIDGALSGELSFDYRILVAGPCGSPAGTYEEEWIAYGTFSGTVDGRKATATLLYTADVRAGGTVKGSMILRGGVKGELEISGEFADRQLSYSGVAHLTRGGGGEERSKASSGGVPSAASVPGRVPTVRRRAPRHRSVE